MLDRTGTIHHRTTSTATKTSPLQAMVTECLACVTKFVVINGDISDIFRQESLCDTSYMLFQLRDYVVVLVEGTPYNFDVLFVIVQYRINSDLRCIRAKLSEKKAISVVRYIKITNWSVTYRRRIRLVNHVSLYKKRDIIALLQRVTTTG
jgi:hypothetical protein